MIPLPNIGWIITCLVYITGNFLNKHAALATEVIPVSFTRHARAQMHVQSGDFTYKVDPLGFACSNAFACSACNVTDEGMIRSKRIPLSAWNIHWVIQLCPPAWSRLIAGCKKQLCITRVLQTNVQNSQFFELQTDQIIRGAEKRCIMTLRKHFQCVLIKDSIGPWRLESDSICSTPGRQLWLLIHTRTTETVI